MDVALHDPSAAGAWDAFVDASRNGTFILKRPYMDYHADRFHDHSLVFREGGEIVAVLPAHVTEDALVSHGGLTYGGLVSHADFTLGGTLRAFDALVARMRDSGLTRLVYKTVPAIYHDVPSDEDRYALFRHGARLVRRDVLQVIDTRKAAKVQQRRLRSLRKAEKLGVVVEPATDYGPFWQVMAERLQARYGIKPVHSVEEITLLAGRFPDNIRLYTATRGGEVLAGVVLFVSRHVCHVQYSVASPAGFEASALDVLLMHALETCRDGARCLDLGAVTESGGTVLNEGLTEYKESFGARSVVHDTYELVLDSREGTCSR